MVVKKHNKPANKLARAGCPNGERFETSLMLLSPVPTPGNWNGTGLVLLEFGLFGSLTTKISELQAEQKQTIRKRLS